jgi:hypothetical protein
MHCTVPPVKFDGGLFISVLRNEQLFTKKIEGLKIDQFSKSPNLQHFHPPPFGKSPTFLESQFSCERNRNPTIKLNMNLEVHFGYRLILKRLGVLE